MFDVLEKLFNLYKFDHKLIRQIASGSRYFAVELLNGNIGVCATLGKTINPKLPDKLNLDNINHRIILCAYYNALVNYRSPNISPAGDITQAVNFKKYQNIHFVGKFAPVFEKLEKQNISFTYADLRDQDDPQNRLKDQTQLLNTADCVVISATAVYNGTLPYLIRQSPNADRFLLGPSSTMSPILCEAGFKAVFGSQFKPYDSRVLGLIAQNYGTKYFLRRGTKTMLSCESTQKN